MSENRVDAVVRAAIAEGTLPATATVPGHDERPWPIVLLTAFGAWLAALPLFGLVGMMLSGALERGVGLFVVGAIVVGGAVAALRRPALPLFVEQLVFPALIVGIALLGWGLYRDVSAPLAPILLAVIALACAFAIERAWLRVVLGAAAATLLALAWWPSSGSLGRRGFLLFWLAWQLNLLLWVAAGLAQRSLLVDGARASTAATLESVRAGWLLATLLGLAWWSGMTFLVGASVSGRPFGEVFDSRDDAGVAVALMRAASLALAVAGAAWSARRWPALRNPAAAGVAAVLVALAWFMPALGAALLALAACATGKRWRLAAAAALTAAWIVGGFYYQLAWPLASKAAVLIVAGIVLGTLAWLGFRTGRPTATPGDAPVALPWGAAGIRALPLDRTGIAATALLVLLVGNGAIWQKERLIANGQPVFVELAPVDPRSLMQGDYMQLDFAMPAEIREAAGGLLDRERPFVVARRDARGVVTLLRLDRGQPLAADELRIELAPAGGDWVLVTDAWSFAEGEAERWARAKYGEFRVDAHGRALLVGLRGPNLEAL